jgi:hypothetical protein
VIFLSDSRAISVRGVTGPSPAKVHGNHAVTRAQRLGAPRGEGAAEFPAMQQDNWFTPADAVVGKANPTMPRGFHFRFLQYV